METAMLGLGNNSVVIGNYCVGHSKLVFLKGTWELLCGHSKLELMYFRRTKVLGNYCVVIPN